MMNGMFYVKRFMLIAAYTMPYYWSGNGQTIYCDTVTCYTKPPFQGTTDHRINDKWFDWKTVGYILCSLLFILFMSICCPDNTARRHTFQVCMDGCSPRPYMDKMGRPRLIPVSLSRKGDGVEPIARRDIARHIEPPWRRECLQPNPISRSRPYCLSDKIAPRPHLLSHRKRTPRHPLSQQPESAMQERIPVLKPPESYNLKQGSNEADQIGRIYRKPDLNGSKGPVREPLDNRDVNNEGNSLAKHNGIPSDSAKENLENRDFQYGNPMVSPESDDCSRSTHFRCDMPLERMTIYMACAATVVVVANVALAFYLYYENHQLSMPWEQPVSANLNLGPDEADLSSSGTYENQGLNGSEELKRNK